MGFRINNNIAALVARGNLYNTNSSVQTSIERLSSGLRINRGADDAAGLTISEKLRGQINGLNRAIGNAQDGISLIQTAEGALNEDAAILNRLRELAVQSQADSLTINDRLEIQKEVDQLVDEIDRISLTTEFNTKKLLDGTANALVSTNNNDLQAFQSGLAGPSAGDYDINILLEDAGVKQVQASAIMKNKENGAVAGLSTKLSDLESMYDNDGNLIIDVPTKVTLRANGNVTEVTLSGDLTLEEVGNTIENSVTKSVASGGLGITGSTFAFNTQSGQFFFTSGRDGLSGELAISTNENLIKAFGFQIVSESKAAAFKVTATTVGNFDNVSKTTTSNTTTNTAKGIVDGIDLKFQLPSEARIDGSVAAVDTITLGDDDIVFTFHDTNGTADGNGITQAPGSITAGVTITLTNGRTFTLTSIADRINDTIAAANDASSALTTAFTSSNFQVPGVTASFDGFNLVLTSSIKGTSGSISISANNAASELLGINSGKVTGKGGTNAVITGTTVISDGVVFNGTGITYIQLHDGDFNTNYGASSGGGTGLGDPGMQDPIADGGFIGFNQGVNISATSVVDTFNTYFSVNNIKAGASLTSDGKLEIRSTETGGDARISITLPQAGDSLAVLGMLDGQSSLGTGGAAAVYTGATNGVAKSSGYTLASALNFQVTDKNGSTTETIEFITDNVSRLTESFTISKAAIASILDASTLKTTDVDYGFDAGGRLDFFSRSAGKDSRVVFNTVTIGAGAVTQADMETIGRVGLGIDFGSASQGSGQTRFNLHVSDRRLNFQVGANKSQILDFGIVNTGADALGLKGLDITNIKVATKALGDIDRAVNLISSERSKLGSLQNRMTATIRNLSTTSTNLQSTESLIRDVDVAKETLSFTRSQILIQAGTAQLAQAQQLPQGALQLLG